MGKLVCTLSACSDCVCYCANSDIPEERPDLAREIADHLQLKPGQHLVNADGWDESGEFDPEDNGEEWFAWSGCGRCGSPLGGMRNRLAILED